METPKSPCVDLCETVRVFNNLHGIFFKNSRKWSTRSSGMPFLHLPNCHDSTQCGFRVSSQNPWNVWQQILLCIHPWNLISKKNTMKHVEPNDGIPWRGDSFCKNHHLRFAALLDSGGVQVFDQKKLHHAGSMSNKKPEKPSDQNKTNFIKFHAKETSSPPLEVFKWTTFSIFPTDKPIGRNPRSEQPPKRPGRNSNVGSSSPAWDVWLKRSAEFKGSDSSLPDNVSPVFFGNGFCRC